MSEASRARQREREAEDRRRRLQIWLHLHRNDPQVEFRGPRFRRLDRLNGEGIAPPGSYVDPPVIWPED